MADIDKRVVEMKFDNAAFERGVSTTMSTLDKLKEKLNFTGSAKGLSDIGVAAGKIDMGGVGRGVDALSAKFSALQIAGVTALATITTKAVNSAVALVKSFTIAPVLDGFHQYEKQINATQTILANTAAGGAKLKDVTATLATLNDYANKTIYNFSDMATNLGTFTSAGIKLGPAADAIQGLSNVAAAAGAGTQQAAGAMYQLSQALGRGSIQAQDWNSVVAAGMASSSFQRSLLETAKALGTLKIPKSETIDEWTKKGGNFRDAMSKGQLTSKVLIQTLEVMKGQLTDTQMAQMGYTAEQIKSLKVTAALGVAAAVNVKTFSALKDNLSQGVGSAWANVFKTLFGDLPAATTLFTKLSVILNKIFVDPVNHLNDFLIKLKAMGALGNFVEGFKNIFKALAEVFLNVRHAFREIFPPSSGQTLLALSKAFKTFTDHLLMSDGTAGALMKTFEGVFAVFRIVIDILGGVTKGFFGLFGIVGTGGKGVTHTILAFTSVAGVFLMHLQQWIEKTGAIKTFFTVFTSPLKLLKPTVDMIVNLASAIASLATGDISGFKTQIGGIVSTFTGTFTTLISGYRDFSNILSDGLKRITTFFSDMSDNARRHGNTFVANVAGVAATITGVLGRYSKILGDVFSNIITWMSGATNAVKNFFIGFASGPISAVTGIVDKLAGSFQGLRDQFDGFNPKLASFNTNAGAAASGGGSALVKVGHVISTVWGAIVSIGSGIGSVLATVGSAIGRFFGALGSSIRDHLKNFDMMDLIAVLNTGMLFLILNSFRGLAKDIGGAFKNIGGTFSSLKDTLKAFQREVKAKIILEIGIAIGILVAALVVLTQIDAKKLATGLGALAVIFGELAGMLKIVTIIDPKSLVGAGVGMIGIATAVLVLAHAVKFLGTMDPKVLTQGSIAIAALMAALAGMAAILNGMKGIFVAATGLLILAVALTAMAGAIALYAAIPFGVVKSGIEKMAIALIALGIAMAFFPPGMIAKSVGITILAAALLILTASITALGLLPLHVIVKGIGAMAVALVILAVAANAMTGAIVGAAAMLIVAGAIAVLAPALALMGNLSMATIGKGLLAMTAVMLIFVGAMYLLTPIIPVVAIFAESILTLGLASLAAGAGFALFVGALGLLTVIGAAGFAVLTAGIISLIALLPLMAQQLGYAIITFANVIKLAAPKLAEAAGVVVMAFVNEIAKRVPQIADAGLRMILGLLTAIKNNIGKITTTAIDIVIAFLRAIKSRLPGFIQAGIELIVSFLNGLAQGIRKHKKEIGDAGANLASAIVEGIISGFGSAGKILDKGIHALGNYIIKTFKSFFGIKSPSTVFAGLGGFIIEGLANGIGDAFGLVKKAIEALAHKLPGWMKNILGIHSPSTVFHELGGFVGEGFANGIDATSDRVHTSTQKMGADALKGIKGVISNISDSISTNMDSAPTIRPVLDLTHVEQNAGKIHSMLATNPIKADAATSSVRDISTGHSATQATAAFNAAQTQKALQALAAAKPAQAEGPRPVEFHIGTVEDGDSLLRRARATNKMLTLAEGGDSTQVVSLV